MSFIAAYDPVDGDPGRYVEFLRDTYRNAKRIMSLPVQQWPRGSSHEISRGMMIEAEAKAQDMMLQYGVFDAYGKLTGYASR